MFAGGTFTLFYLSLLLYFVRRQFDLFSYVFLVSALYFTPAFFGVVTDASFPIILEEIVFSTYVFYYGFYFVLILFAEFSSYATNVVTISRQYSAINSDSGFLALENMIVFLRFGTPLLLIGSYVVMGDLFFEADKQVFLDNQTRLYSMWQQFACLYCFLSFVGRKWGDLLIGLLFASVDLYIGFRGVVVFGMLCIFLFYGLRANKSRKFMFGFLLMAVFGLVLSAIYKAIIVFVKIGDDDTALDRLLDIDGFLESVYVSESFITQQIFNTVIQVDFSIPLSHIFETLRVFLPSLHVHIFGAPTGFNDYFQNELFPNIPWGMASNIWAEQFALLGWGGLFLTVIVFFVVIFILNRKILVVFSQNRLIFSLFLVFLAAPAIIFMHRNDLAFQLVLIRDNALIFGGVFYCARLLASWRVLPRRSFVK